MRAPTLFGALFAGPEWVAWRAFLSALFGLPMPAEDQAALYRRSTGRQDVPMGQAREAWVIVGRRGGKSRIAALIAVYLACFNVHAHTSMRMLTRSNGVFTEAADGSPSLKMRSALGLRRRFWGTLITRRCPRRYTVSVFANSCTAGTCWRNVSMSRDVQQTTNSLPRSMKRTTRLHRAPRR